MAKEYIKQNKGFVIIFAVTLSAILLAIALGVSNVAQEEVKFGTSAKSTGDAFFAADTGFECAALYDRSNANSFPVGGPATAISCAGQTITPSYIPGSNIGQYDFVVTGMNGTACAKVRVNKDGTTPGVMNTAITATGYNTGDAACNSASPDRVERELVITYSTNI